MKAKGRKRGVSDDEARRLREMVVAEYDRLVAEERNKDSNTALYLPTKYYVDKLFDMHIVPWSWSYIHKVITNRFRNERG